MALSESQKAGVRLYLGFDRGRDLHPELESRMDVGVLTADEESVISTALVQLGQVDAKLLSAGLNNLDLVKAEDVTFLGPEQLDALRGLGRQLIRRLEIVCAITARRDYFDASGAASIGGLILLG